ncbi:DNA mismatch repair endonuclease MutL [uncultured Fretibacterium sp.]|uniref:DNA mismatch repair endonuclease MutL n=1 Tax=uncultured Fretibacterium sp. TaxID=1678694 RepID=UPI00260C4DFB|nr:DNA mismatch repair endonuclease MutL [uncultured Fretibacterium sp.]
MPEIRELPEGVWTRIAAGEVVERPASAVKELVENALDAGARRVRVRLWDGGRLRIVVEDDGCGIGFEDLPLALLPHATSKLRGIEDLENIRTLGYRGEALASLVAVADLEIRSRPEGGAGGLIRASGGRVTEHVAAACAPGTRVQADELFKELPARRKFMKSASGELRRAASVMREYAVARPDVSFALEHDGREVLSTDGGGDRRRVLERLWGAEPPIQTAEAEAGHLSLVAWLQSRQGRSDVMAFVNGRAVNDPVVKGAVTAAARELTGNWALFLSLDPSLVDVNIHPAKAEVRFRYAGEVFEAVREAAGKLGAPAPLTFPSAGAAASGAGSRAAVMERGWSFREGPTLRPTAPRLDPPPASSPPLSPFSRVAPPDFGGPARPASSPPAALSPREERDEPSPSPEDTPAMEAPVYMGQTSQGYLIFDTPEGLVLMDPHAAHERVGYERIRDRATGEAAVQKLLIPTPLPPTLALEAEEYRAALEAAGFSLESHEGGLRLAAVPALPDGAPEPEALLRASLAALKGDQDGDAKELLWRTWATMACKAAVKLTTALASAEALALWRDLHRCVQPFHCPHGRPTMLVLGPEELLRRFGRE